jgi:hypothetical protein
MLRFGAQVGETEKVPTVDFRPVPVLLSEIADSLARQATAFGELAGITSRVMQSRRAPRMTAKVAAARLQGALVGGTRRRGYSRRHKMRR